MTDGAGNLVSIRDIDVPFWRIVMIMIKWSIAAIPATIILVAIGRWLYPYSRLFLVRIWE
ncbi:MAG TPA: hypothetical protein VED02_05010 [Methyloceanibacter sp.]|nr:hypothetical protein [Methyloceanibacter sp.]